MKPKINFLCVGAQKSGTTTLFEILKQHPDIYLPEVKETHFFDDDALYNKGIDFLIKNFYSSYQGEKAVGDITPAYMYFEYVPERIYKTLGKDIKLIFILRNPADRAFSHYLMTYRRGLEYLNFWDAIKEEPKRLKKGYFHRIHYSYIDRGYYAKQIKRFLKFFPRENMKIFIFEKDFLPLEARKKTISEILEFLEVENIELNINIKSNEGKIPKNIFLQTFIYSILYRENRLKQFLRSLIKSKSIKEEAKHILKKLKEKNLFICLA